MTTTTLRISTQLRDSIADMARSAGTSMQKVLEQSIEAYRRQQILQATNAAYAALQADEKQWRALEEERASWDVTLTDGLDIPHTGTS